MSQKLIINMEARLDQRINNLQKEVAELREELGSIRDTLRSIDERLMFPEQAKQKQERPRRQKS